MARRSKKKSSPPETPPSAQNSPVLPINKKCVLFQALLIAAVTFWIYFPALNGDWLWDDSVDITQNAVTQAPDGLWKIWFEPGIQLDYYPIKASVQWLQWHLWHAHTFGYHLTNMVLHIIGALLVWRLLDKLGLRLAWLGGLLFAVHPVQVESVAWIVELKNTLSLPPFLLAMCFFIDYDAHKKWRDYLLALGFFLAAMLCKTTMVMFPVIILLHAWWKRGRIRWRDLEVSMPFFAVSLALGATTIFVDGWYSQLHHIHPAALPTGDVFYCLVRAGLSLSFYFSLCFWPVRLLPMYPQWTIDPASPVQYLPWLVVVAIFYLLWQRRKSWGRHALLGLGFFAINLALFVGFNTISYMRITWVMDHFLYIPLIGLIGLVVAGLEKIREQLPVPFRLPGIGIVTLAIAFLAWESHSYAAQFIDQKTLWTYTIQRNPGAWMAHNNLGYVYFQAGRISDAIDQFEQVIKINPGYAEAHNNLGAGLMQMNRISEAITEYREAIQISPDYTNAHINLGKALEQSGHASEAMEQYEAVLQYAPGNVEARQNLERLQRH